MTADGNTSGREDTQKAIVWGLCLLLAALLAIRMLALATNATDLFFDEAQYWSWSLDPSFGYYSKPPLIAWAIRAATEACGSTEFCIRLPSPLFHTASALLIFAIARTLFDARVGLLSALAFATLPGISLSAGIISTDAPLLTFWALALYGFVALDQTKRWWPALLLAVGLGLGLNAKYAMAYFAAGLAAYAVWCAEGRARLRDIRVWLGLAGGLLLILPNLAWNSAHNFATFSHTADNAKWSGALFSPGKALEFFAAQFGVFGPVLFAALLLVVWRGARTGFTRQQRLLLSFALPVIVIVTLQAFISRAHANWAAVAYVSATIAVIATMVHRSEWRWLRLSFSVHLVVLASLIAATAFADRITLPGGANPFARTLGWQEVANTTTEVIEQAKADGVQYRAVLGAERALVAELLYYMPRTGRTYKGPPVLAWRAAGRPLDHYELTRPYSGVEGEPILLVSLTKSPDHILSAFGTVEQLESRDVKAGQTNRRRLYFFRLSGFSRPM